MTATQGMHSLSTILKRLEAVTSRLEDVAVSQSSQAPTSSLRSPTSSAHDDIAGHVAPPAPPPPPAPAPPAASPPVNAKGPAVLAYESEIISSSLQDFLSKAADVGGVVQQHASLFAAVCDTQAAFLLLASGHTKPTTLAPLLEPQAKAIQAVLEAKDKLGRSKDGREFGPFFSVLGEGVSAWGWVQVEPAPAPFIVEMKNAAQFWADRVIKQFKETNPAIIACVRSFMSLLDVLQQYVKQWHTTGVTWNPKGAPAPSSVPTAPPPPPPAPASTAPSAASAPAGGATALLADLNRGGNVTSGLRKVDASQMTHKNPELRSSGAVSDKKAPAPPIKPKPTVAAKKPAKFDLEDGNKWMIEYQEDNKSIVIENSELHQTVHIFGCKNSVVKINGKVNAITMVGCKKTAVVVESAVSSFSITSSPSFEVQVTGTIPTIQIDTTDSGSVYLSQECMDSVEIITSKTSSINISVPTGEGGDFEERPVPEQMKSRVVNGKLVTEIIGHAG